MSCCGKGGYSTHVGRKLGRVWLDGFHGTKKQRWCHGKNATLRRAALFNEYKCINLQAECSPSVVFTPNELEHLIDCGEQFELVIDDTAGEVQAASSDGVYKLSVVDNFQGIFNNATPGTDDTYHLGGWGITYHIDNTLVNGSVLLRISFNQGDCLGSADITALYQASTLQPCNENIIEPLISECELILDGYLFRADFPCLKANVSGDGSDQTITYSADSNVVLSARTFITDFISRTDECC